jgi:hypothetical protein
VDIALITRYEETHPTVLSSKDDNVEQHGAMNFMNIET